MSVPEIAPECAAHLKSVTEFYQAEPKASVFASAYRDLLAHRYNLLIPEDARMLEVGCGASDLLHRIRARDKIGVDLSPEQDCGPIVRKLAFFGGDPLKKRILPITLPGPSFSASPTNHGFYPEKNLQPGKVSLFCALVEGLSEVISMGFFVRWISMVLGLC